MPKAKRQRISSPDIFFFSQRGKYGFLSNWAYSPTFYKGTIWPTSEHALIYAKITLFQDWDAEKKLMKADSPQKAKHIGRQVKGFIEGKWANLRYYYLLEVLRSKFSGAVARQQLLDTGNARLYEASPHDAIYGIGMNKKTALEPDHPPFGKNLLGKALEAIREEIRHGQNPNGESDSEQDSADGE